MKKLLSVKVRHNLLVPGWIATFGFVALSAPPLGVATSLSLFVVGVFVVPVLVMIPGAADPRADRPRQPAGPVNYFHFGFWRAALRG
jgi:hypothetical protein